MLKNIYKDIYKTIKKYNRIVIARHIGADPDALASQIALRDTILNTFPKKEVYAVGYPASKFKFLGILDKFSEELYENSLLIVLDTPDIKRIDNVDYSRFKQIIKIDHHPLVDQYANIEWIDDKASSTSQMIIELMFNSKLKITKEAAEKLYIGVVSDTNRFLFSYTSSKTFELISKLIKKTNIDVSSLYEALYLRPIKEVKFEGYIANNMIVSENGFAYIMITEEILSEFNVDSATAGNVVNNFNYIDEVICWAVFSIDKNNDIIRCSIRSRGPIINEVASHYNGGGHIYASGVRIKDEADVQKLIVELDEACSIYKTTNEKT
ncbi:MAG: bifunctional oligoribonuclease/PAP phosphatase NrnA [Bacilli bacterium]|nr:bifunctional oligoribonuclease/PAP phosphatase NrnA [Bacilli bacterium]